MLLSLEDHFEYWDEKVYDINESARIALEKMMQKHEVYHSECREFLESVRKLTPN